MNAVAKMRPTVDENWEMLQARACFADVKLRRVGIVSLEPLPPSRGRDACGHRFVDLNLLHHALVFHTRSANEFRETWSRAGRHGRCAFLEYFRVAVAEAGSRKRARTPASCHATVASTPGQKTADCISNGGDEEKGATRW